MNKAYRLLYVLPALALAACDTDEASQVTATSARLNLKNPPTDCTASNPCKWYYEISSDRAVFDDSPGIPTASTTDNIPSVPKVWDGGPTVPDPAVVKTGLIPNTRYHFRVCGARGTGPFYCGTVRRFVTMEGLKLSPDKTRFVLDVSGTEFIPFGYTYHQMDPASAEILRITSWNMSKFASNVDEMKQVGANTIRIRPQIGELMSGPSTMNGAGVERLIAVLDVLERKNVYVDIVGLADYARDPAPWYEALDEVGRHEAQEFFWTHIADAVKGSPAVLALNLINEPFVPDTPQTSWRFGSMDDGNYWFCNYLVKDRGPRTERDVLREWLQRMSTAVRAVNGRHLMTFGSWHEWHVHGAWMKDYVDFFEPHIYPNAGVAGHVPASIASTASWATHGRPVFVGETGSFLSGSRQQTRFVKSIRPHVKGVLSHFYSNATPTTSCTDIPCAIRTIELFDMGDISTFFRSLTTAGRKTALRRFVNVAPVTGLHLHSDSADPNVDRDLTQRRPPAPDDACKAGVFSVTYRYSPEADAGVILKVAEPNTAALARFWNGTTNVSIHMKDPSEMEIAYLKTLGYCYDRLLGFVYKTWVTGTVPLYKCTSMNDEVLQKSTVCPAGFALSSEPLGYVF